MLHFSAGLAMNSPRFAGRRGLLVRGSLWKLGRSVVSAFLALATMSALHAADAPPVVAKPDAKAAVSITENGTTFTLANGIVTARINKRNGDLESLDLQGPGRRWATSRAGPAIGSRILPRRRRSAG